MSDTPAPDAATDAGTTRPAGEELSDDAAVAEVADQTASDLKAQDFFKRESEGVVTHKPARETKADEIADAG
jgi:hypothetical protein